MWTFRKKGVVQSTGTDAGASTKARGDLAEQAALEHLQKQGLRLVKRNFKTPGRGGGEVDLIMREPDGTLVFVEVRQRTGSGKGGAGASITVAKKKRIVLAARHFLHQIGSEPPCRFDVVLLQGPSMGGSVGASIEWLRAAFDTSASF
ncbi:YraN family protein [Hydrogenophaga sp.]|uniref:YraN family protein n=1 Tax=Hydrogenophaga sp. TaxID=1904254 RepID=UPI00271DCA6A|nr:YraN family protein [Hydrogenophaga sp.]MDO8905735.1 YraN family protein [Hydrogenophaga sp.]